METTTAIATQGNQQITPLELIQSALKSGTPPEVIRELVLLQQSMERFNWEREERQAEQDFGDALTECQRQIGRIAPNVHRENNIWWADYVQLDRTVRPIYLAAGFALSFSDAETDDKGRVRIRATLKRGRIEREYFKEISRTAASSKMSQPDADASAASRAKRYLLLDIFNIAVGIDKDEKAGIPSEEAKTLTDIRYADLMSAIEGASNPEERRVAFARAWNEAGAIKDYKARAKFKEIYERLKEQD